MSKNVILGVTGSIASYKAASIASGLIKLGYNVNVIMTDSAQKFVTPLLFQSITKNPVMTDVFDEPNVKEYAHIELAVKADVILIAPATANTIGKLANGIADNALTTTMLASPAPKIIAVAMNVNMYHNALVQKNLRILAENNFVIIDPVSGVLACGMEGDGKLADTKDIIKMVEKYAGAN